MARMKAATNLSRKEHILKEAAHLFKEKGYKAASMRELAENVGIEAASLYNHISGKSELLQIMCFNVASRFIQKIEEVEADDIPVIAKVKNLLHFHIHEMLTNYEEVFVSDREWRQLPEPELSKYREQRRSYRKRFAATIQKGIDNLEIKNIDANTVVMIFLNAIAAIDQWHRINTKVSPAELESHMITVLIEGLRK